MISFTKYIQNLSMSITGAIITKTKFGFVQFAEDEACKLCLADGTSAVINGHRIGNVNHYYIEIA